MVLDVHDAGLMLMDPDVYADESRFHEACTVLRGGAPVHWVNGSGEYNPFWAITRHADIKSIERNNAIFLNAPRPILQPASEDRRQREEGSLLRPLNFLDDPEHRALRPIAADWFRPRTLRLMQQSVNSLAKRSVDRMQAIGNECDFVNDVAVDYPLYVILSLLGLPESDFPRMLTLTQELFGMSDPERQRESDTEDRWLAVIQDFFAYFRRLAQDRRNHPTEDLASAIANSQIDGSHLGEMELISYYIIIATAGHDTTTSTIAGGLHALMQHSDQLHRLREDMSLLPRAVEEMLRWVTPVKGFMRTAATDHAIGEATVRKGDSVMLVYPSANRDENVFTRPFDFDIARDPNPHLSFGTGVHFCLGAALARMEIQAFFTELLPRLDSIELAGATASIPTTVVGGLKRMPVRYALRDSVVV